MKKIIILSLALLFAIPQHLEANEGMWLPMFLKRNIEDMQKMGLQLSAEELYDINNSSLKDAIVSFSGYCTGEVISSQGLILTNHHCGYDAIQSHSTVEDNILKNGYWAKTLADEKKNDDLFVDFLIRMDDVTARILAELNSGMTEDQRAKAIDEAIETIKSEFEAENGYWIEIKPFFEGNEFYKFTYQRFDDVRLVGTPPESVGKYGGDTDNWMWPRQTGDFAMFRVYTDIDGNPAPYAISNIPMKPKHHLPISMKGVEAGDFTMVWGYPGGTDRYLSSWGVQQAIEENNPTVVDIRRVKLDVLDEKMAADEKVRIQYASKYANTSNYWKYFIGQTKGLKALDVVKDKQKLEQTFRDWTFTNPKIKTKYGKTLSLIQESVEASAPFIKPAVYIREAALIGPDITLFALRSSRLLDRMLNADTPEPNKTAMLAALKDMAKSHFKDYNMETDIALFVALMHKYNTDIDQGDMKPSFFKSVKKGNFQKFAHKAYSKSVFVNEAKFFDFIEDADLKTLKKDPFFNVQESIYMLYQQMNSTIAGLESKMGKGNRLFVAGLRQMNPDKNYYPNANFTMRFSYGDVNAYEPRDGVLYKHYTTLEGVMEKMDNSNPEFVVPQKLVDLFEAKNYGPYANKDGELPVCFIDDNDITGGNSGSPVINAKGELVGCAFDGNWEAMSGDIAFEHNLQRTISVDVRYILFIIDKYADAKHIVDEMTLVR